MSTGLTLQQERAWVETLQAGDLVAVEINGKFYIEKVLRTTKTLVVTGLKNGKFSNSFKKDTLSTNNSFYRIHMMRLTPEISNKVHVRRNKEMIKKLIDEMILPEELEKLVEFRFELDDLLTKHNVKKGVSNEQC